MGSMLCRRISLAGGRRLLQSHNKTHNVRPIVLYPFRSQNVVNLHTSRNVKKTRTFVNSDPVSGRHGGMAALSHKNHPRILRSGRSSLYVAVGALMLSSTLSVLATVRGMKGVCRFGQNDACVQDSCWKTRRSRIRRE